MTWLKINDSEELGLLQCRNGAALRILVDAPVSQVRRRQCDLIATLKISSVANRKVESEGFAG